MVFRLAIGTCLLCLVTGQLWSLVSAADIPPAPKPSTFAPADDLVKALDDYITRIGEALESQDEFSEFQARVVKDAETIAVLGLVLGLHDEKNQYQSAAPAIVKAAQELSAAAAKDYASAKSALAALEAAKTSSADATGLKWEKVASLKELMQQVPLVNSRLKRNMRRFERQADTIAVDAAVIAAISQASMANLDETTQPNQAEKWFSFCADSRDAAAALGKAAKAKNQADAEKALAAMTKSCDDCHAVFHPQALGKTDAE